MGVITEGPDEVIRDSAGQDFYISPGALGARLLQPSVAGLEKINRGLEQRIEELEVEKEALEIELETLRASDKK
jgi:hypothetical protein